jgi:hypothetical protein
MDRPRSKHGEKRNAYRILVGKPEGKKPLRRPSSRRADNIKNHNVEVGCVDVVWVDLALDREMQRAYFSAVMNRRIP